MVMDSLYFQDYENFINHVLEQYVYDFEGDEDITIVAKYNAACEIIRELICRTDFDLESISLDGEYTKEYMITIEGTNIWCEPMYDKDHYIPNVATIIYVLGDCSSKVIKHCEALEIFEVNITDEFKDESDIEYTDCDEECKECKCCKYDIAKKDSKNVSLYEINGKSVSKEDFERSYRKLVDELDHKVLDLSNRMSNFSGIFDIFLHW